MRAPGFSAPGLPTPGLPKPGSSKSDEHGRSWLTSRFEVTLVWIVGHVSAIAPLLVFGVVLAVSWSALRDVRVYTFRLALRALDPRWLTIAALLTVANIAVMGLYDVVAFSHTRSSASERWRFGAVAFAWSNFLSLGPLAGPAIRFWLYRPNVDDPADLHEGVVAISTAFMSGLFGWTVAALFAGRFAVPFV